MISYEELSKVFDMDNPLTLEYFELCGKDTEEPKYFHKHHILPKSLFTEHRSSNWNLVKLCFKDHYRAHEILPFICINPKHRQKMALAWSFVSRNKETKEFVTPELFETLNKMNMEARSGSNHPQYGKKMSQEHIERLRKINTGRKASEETKAKMSKVRTGVKKDPAHVEKVRLANIGKVMSDESRAKMSLVRKGRIINQQWRNNLGLSSKISAFRKGLNVQLDDELVKAIALQDAKQGRDSYALREAALLAKELNNANP